MRILLTNDDGIHAAGLKLLESIAAELSDDVTVVAPESDQSGVAYSLPERPASPEGNQRASFRL